MCKDRDIVGLKIGDLTFASNFMFEKSNPCSLL